MRPISERLIISIYDHSEAWVEFYKKAGYPVICWDKQTEGDILEDGNFERLVTQHREYVYGIISATPCDDFAVSGARWWKEKDKNTERINISCALAQVVLIMKSLCDDLKFWAQENPVGRLEKLLPEFIEYRKMSFNPSDFGDPYTKKTILWGEFNSNLQKTPVLNLFGSMMHQVPPGKDQKKIRSTTPLGFAKAFFLANQ